MFIVKRAPKNFKVTQNVSSFDLTVELLVTNNAGTAKSCVDGSLLPMEAYDPETSTLFSNLDKINAKLVRRARPVISAPVVKAAPPKRFNVRPGSLKRDGQAVKP